MIETLAPVPAVDQYGFPYTAHEHYDADTGRDDLPRFEVGPFLFGPEYDRPGDPTRADYWTVYRRGLDGTAHALTDARTLGDAVTWLAAGLTAPAPVDLFLTVLDTELRLAPMPVTPEARALLEFDVTAAEHAAGVCCPLGPITSRPACVGSTFLS